MKPLGQVLLGLLLLAVCVLLFLASYERRSEEEWQQPSAQARSQLYLAAERLLQGEGVTVNHVDSYAQLDGLGAGTTLVLPAGRGLLGEAASDQIDAFLAAGGHLLIESEALRNDDPLLDHLGIERREQQESGEPVVDDEFEQYEDDPDDWWLDHYKRPLKPLPPLHRDLLIVSWDGLPQPLLVSSRGGEHLHTERATRLQIDGPEGTRILQLSQGAGLLTVVNDIGFAQNWRIGRHDNAEFLWQLLPGPEGLEQVLFYRGRNEGLFAWLRQHAWKVLLSAALLLLLAGWRAAPRFGPLAADPEPVRRRLGDHLLASGRFLWSHGERRRLLLSALSHARAELYRHAPHLRLAPPESQAQHLVERLAIPPSAASAIVSGQSHAVDAHQFVQMLRACRQLQLRLRSTLASSNDPGPEH